MASKPTQRTLANLRDAGYLCAIVEHWNAHVRRRQDLYGFGDILAVRAEPSDRVIIQTCAAGDVAKRQAKIDDDAHRPAVETCIRSGMRIEVWGWGKRGPRGKRKLWTPRIVERRLNGWIEIEVDHTGFRWDVLPEFNLYPKA